MGVVEGRGHTPIPPYTAMHQKNAPFLLVLNHLSAMFFCLLTGLYYLFVSDFSSYTLDIRLDPWWEASPAADVLHSSSPPGCRASIYCCNWLTLEFFLAFWKCDIHTVYFLIGIMSSCFHQASKLPDFVIISDQISSGLCSKGRFSRMKTTDMDRKWSSSAIQLILDYFQALGVIRLNMYLLLTGFIAPISVWKGKW